MNINVTVPDENSAQVLEGIAAATGWTNESGKTKAQWAKEQVIRAIKNLATNGAVKVAMTSIKTTLDGAAIT